MSDERDSRSLSRRGFLKGLGIGTAGVALSGAAGLPARAEPGPPGEGESQRDLDLTVNGTAHALRVEPRRTLAAVLREDLGLTGTKISCDRASCGACTVLLDGEAVYSCHLLALQARGKSVQTIEGLAEGEVLHPLQEAFIECDATQCGFCTPGMIMAIQGVLAKDPRPTREAMIHGISGNLCRCGAYNHILDAAMKVAGRKP